MNDLQKMKNLIEKIKEADEAYFKKDSPIMTDREYDALVLELKMLERITGIHFSNSPIGKVPSDEKDLVSLAGVGRKTASVVQSIAFKIPAIAVDTHVFRLSHRLGITSKKTPDKVQDDLQAKIDKKYWIDFNTLFVTHGQNICKPINPKCEICSIKEFCKKNI